jgi:hypothetical protein
VSGWVLDTLRYKTGLKAGWRGGGGIYKRIQKDGKADTPGISRAASIALKAAQVASLSMTDEATP